ncbi:MAG: SDR family oxidoreductase [Bacteroidales bacterium]|nr:SDR family oxidoreductase [Bacteroidales bacterium]MCF8399632.1 SDR family oxidoreductase [Bacteroidales bacterium]
MMQLKNKKALITGGSKGIGKAIALAFAREGIDIAISGRNENALLKTAEEIQQYDVDCLVLAADMAKDEEVKEAAQKALDFSPHWDILVNNAGIAKKVPLLELEMKDWDEIMQVNLKSVLLLSQMMAKPMIKNKRGKIINISSLGAFYGTPGMAAYAVSKAGLNQLTRTMAVEWGPHNIQANAICPTVINTDMAKEIWDAPENREMKKKFLEKIPAGRFGEPHDVADLALFLASDASDFINGLSIPLEGGRMAN